MCLCVYVQTPNAADLRRSGTCGWHPLGAGRYFTVGVDNVLLLYMERSKVDRQGKCSDAGYNCRTVDPVCRSPTPNSTDLIVPQRAVSKCPLTQNLSTPETEVRYGFRSFVLTIFINTPPTHVQCRLASFYGLLVRSPSSWVHASVVFPRRSSIYCSARQKV